MFARAQEQQNDERRQGRARRRGAPDPTGGFLELQRSAGNAAVVRAIEDQRHAHDADRGHDPSKTAPPVHGERVIVQTMAADGKEKPPVPPKPAGLVGFKSRGGGRASAPVQEPAQEPAQEPVQEPVQESAPSQSGLPSHQYKSAGVEETITLFRADKRDPDMIRKSGGMRSWQPVSVKTELTKFLEGPREYAQAHIASPNRHLVSTARSEDCGGYASADRHIYKIRVRGLRRFDPPHAKSKILAKPTIYANSESLETATVIIIGPIGPTQEMDFFGDIPMSSIVECRRPGESGYSTV